MTDGAADRAAAGQIERGQERREKPASLKQREPQRADSGAHAVIGRGIRRMHSTTSRVKQSLGRVGLVLG